MIFIILSNSSIFGKFWLLISVVLHSFIHNNGAIGDFKLDTQVHERVQNDVIDGLIVLWDDINQMIPNLYQIFVSLINLLRVLHAEYLTLRKNFQPSEQLWDGESIRKNAFALLNLNEDLECFWKEGYFV